MRWITRLFEAMQEGIQEVGEELLSVVYHELRVLAACKMANEAPGQMPQLPDNTRRGARRGGALFRCHPAFSK